MTMSNRYMTSTRDIDVGSRIDIGFATDGRGVIVTSNEPDGLGVIWYTPNGTGPHHAVLPHGKVGATRYFDERHADRGYMETHPDFTGRYGDV
jgi:hypothetical protein